MGEDRHTKRSKGRASRFWKGTLSSSSLALGIRTRDDLDAIAPSNGIGGRLFHRSLQGADSFGRFGPELRRASTSVSFFLHCCCRRGHNKAI
jgi:hypothetical protein